MAQLQGRASDDVKQELDRLAAHTGDSASAIVGRAVRELLERERWQLPPQDQRKTG